MVALGLIGSILVIEFLEPAEHPGNYQHTSGTHYESASNNPLYLFWKWSTHDPVAFFTFILAIFTGALVVVSGVQIRFLIRTDQTARITAEAALSTAKIMADTAERQLRAYISIRPVRKPTLEIGIIPEAFFVVKNNGQTPAYDTWHWVAGKIVGAEMAYSHSMPELPSDRRGNFGSRTTIAAGREIGIRGHGGTALTQEEFAAIMENEARFFIWGEIHYKDAFHKARYTKYRFDVDAATIKTATTLIRHCEQGNDAT